METVVDQFVGLWEKYILKDQVFNYDCLPDLLEKEKVVNELKGIFLHPDFHKSQISSYIKDSLRQFLTIHPDYVELAIEKNWKRTDKNNEQEVLDYLFKKLGEGIKEILRETAYQWTYFKGIKLH